ncbi:14015_t:CDS:1, partial [Dentiscutata heterogama]
YFTEVLNENWTAEHNNFITYRDLRSQFQYWTINGIKKLSEITVVYNVENNKIHIYVIGKEPRKNNGLYSCKLDKFLGIKNDSYESVYKLLPRGKFEDNVIIGGNAKVYVDQSLWDKYLEECKEQDLQFNFLKIASNKEKSLFLISQAPNSDYFIYSDDGSLHMGDFILIITIYELFFLTLDAKFIRNPFQPFLYTEDDVDLLDYVNSTNKYKNYRSYFTSLFPGYCWSNILHALMYKVGYYVRLPKHEYKNTEEIMDMCYHYLQILGKDKITELTSCNFSNIIEAYNKLTACISIHFDENAPQIVVDGVEISHILFVGMDAYHDFDFQPHFIKCYSFDHFMVNFGDLIFGALPKYPGYHYDGDDLNLKRQVIVNKLEFQRMRDSWTDEQIVNVFMELDYSMVNNLLNHHSVKTLHDAFVMYRD